MTVIITYDPPHDGTDYHEQTLYHVPPETAREIVSDFEAFRSSDTEAAAVETYAYSLTAEPSEASSSDDASGVDDIEEPSAPNHGIVALDFRKIASIEGFDPLP
jgi:hypothetical protein